MTIEHEQIHNLVSKVLGQFTVIGIGQERTAFRHALAEEIAARDAKVRAEALRDAADRDAVPDPRDKAWLRAIADEDENR